MCASHKPPRCREKGVPRGRKAEGMCVKFVVAHVGGAARRCIVRVQIASLRHACAHIALIAWLYEPHRFSSEVPSPAQRPYPAARPRSPQRS